MDLLIFFPASIVVFVLGASIGSFINVVVYRLPAGLSILFPPSRCPHCLNQLKAYDNVPVLGWLWLKGRCRFCKSKISLRYPVVEASAGVLFLLVFWVFKFSLLTISYWAFCSWLLTLALIDLDTMILPNSLTQSGLVVGILFQMIIGFTHQASWVGLVNYLKMGVVGAVLGLWLFDLIAIAGSITFGKAAMGGGDAKLAAMMGAWLGWRYLLLAGLIACALGTLVGVAGIVQARNGNRRHSRNVNPTLPHSWGQKMPFGPFLALGAIITLFSGKAILSTYLELFF